MKWLVSALYMWVLILPILAQSKPTVNLDLGVLVLIDPLISGARVALPLTLVTRDESQVAKAHLETSFPSKTISFIGATSGAAAESVKLEIETQLVDSENGETILQIDISASEAIPQGVLLTLTFEVSKQVELGSEIKLKSLKQTSHSIEGQELETAGVDGSIRVLEPLHACLFYLH